MTMILSRSAAAPICLLDVSRMQIRNTSCAWDEIDLVMPAGGALHAAVHPDDRSMLDDLLHDAPHGGRGPARAVIRMAGLDGWRETNVAAVHIDGLLDDHEVMLRLS